MDKMAMEMLWGMAAFVGGIALGWIASRALLEGLLRLTFGRSRS
jgi:hypothetical protein